MNEEEPKNEQPKVTLESIQNEVEKMRNDFATTLKEKEEEYKKSLQEKEDELKNTKDEITNLKKERDEQERLIGNFKEKLFNSSMPVEQVITEKEHFDKELRHAYEQFYRGLESRIVGYDKKAFIDKCMEVEYGNNL